MKSHLPAILHVLLTVVVFLTPSVRAFAASHLAYSAMIAGVWGLILAYLQSPAQKAAKPSILDPSIK